MLFCKTNLAYLTTGNLLL